MQIGQHGSSRARDGGRHLRSAELSFHTCRRAFSKCRDDGTGSTVGSDVTDVMTSTTTVVLLLLPPPPLLTSLLGLSRFLCGQRVASTTPPVLLLLLPTPKPLLAARARFLCGVCVMTGCAGERLVVVAVLTCPSGLSMAVGEPSAVPSLLQLLRLQMVAGWGNTSDPGSWIAAEGGGSATGGRAAAGGGTTAGAVAACGGRLAASLRRGESGC